MNDFEKAEYYLTGLNNENNKLEKLMTGFKNVTNGTEGIELDRVNNKIILKNFKNNSTENIEITLNNKNISSVTAQNIKTALENGANNIKNITNTKMEGMSINEGIILNVGTTYPAMTGDPINNGMISSQYGQGINETHTAINNGIINFTNFGQYLAYSTPQGREAFIINNGMIVHETYSDGGQVINHNDSKNGKIINNGILINASQYLRAGEKHNAYNYGVIENGKQVVGISSSSAYNYGIIYSNDKNAQEISSVSKNSQIKNYRLLTSSQYAQSVEGATNSAYNYGIIRGENDTALINVKSSAKAYNEGVIINESGTEIYSSDVKENAINNGMIVIKGNSITDNFTNNGVVLNSSFEVINKDGINKNVVEFTNGQEITNNTVGGTETGKTSGYIKNGNVTITENLINKNLNAVVTDDFSGKSVFTYKNDENKDLNLINTTITGYFKNKGTLLDVQSGKVFTLAGNSIISAIRDAGLSGTDVTAVKLSSGAILNIVGNAEIIGNVVSNGEKTGIGITAANKGEEAKVESGREASTIIVSNADKSLTDSKIVLAKDNYTNVEFENINTDKLELNFKLTAKDKVNKVVLKDNVIINGDIDGSGTVKYDGTSTDFAPENKIDLTVNNLSNITGNITLGECDDKITVNNVEYSGTIDGNLGNDTLAVNPYTKTRADLENKLNYNIKNIETVELGAGDWTFGENLNISSDNADKNVTVKTTGTLTSYIGKDYKGSLVNNGNADITVAGQDKDKQGTVKYLMGQGFAVKDSITLDDVKIGENAEAKSVVIYDSKVGADGKTTLTLKSAEDMGIKDSTDKKAYEILLGAIEGNDNLRNKFNGYSSEENVVDYIKGIEKSAKAYYTSGYVVTKNIADTYSSIAEDFSKKAGKGEWLAQGKYINSDTEFDGGSKVKGYDGDITGTVGMIEYGVSDQASYGAVFGMGDTEVDIDGGGKLDGDNSYIGAFVKYRTLNGIDLIGNIGFAKSDLDSKLSNEFTIDGITGSSVEFFDGSADSKAITLSLIGKKDFHIADTVRLQPKAGVRYNFIQQEEAKNEGMGFRIAAQDVTIIEGLAGMGIVKDIDLNSGKLALNTGVEYTMSNASKYDEMEYTLYGSKLELENSEMADSRGLFYVGFDYEHESGVGFNGKYEMIWSDTGDDSRVTAGVSYRF